MWDGTDSEKIQLAALVEFFLRFFGTGGQRLRRGPRGPQAASPGAHGTPAASLGMYFLCIFMIVYPLLSFWSVVLAFWVHNN